MCPFGTSEVGDYGEAGLGISGEGKAVISQHL